MYSNVTIFQGLSLLVTYIWTPNMVFYVSADILAAIWDQVIDAL